MITSEQQRELCVWLGIWKDNGPPCVGASGGRWLDNQPVGNLPCPECGRILPWVQRMLIGSEVYWPCEHPEQPPDLTADSAEHLIRKGLNEKGYDVYFWNEGTVKISLGSDDPALLDRGYDANLFLEAVWAAYQRDAAYLRDKP
jgi:hypothetical protein